MPAYEAYGQTYTDPYQRLLSSPHRRDREAALRYLEHQQQIEATRANLQESIAARLGSQAENRAARAQQAALAREATAEGRREHQETTRATQRENWIQRQQRFGELNQARQDSLARQAIEQRDLQAQRLLTALPILQMQAGTDKAKAAQITKSVMDQYQKLAGITLPSIGGPDAGTQAVGAALQQMGKPVVQQPAAQEPAAQQPAQQTTGTPAPTTQQTGPQSPEELAALYDKLYGGKDTEEAGGGAGGVQQQAPAGIPSTAYGYAEPKPGQLIQHGQIYNGPPGMDLNVSTGEWMPSGTVGTINGLPAGQAIALGALRTGITPESRTGMEALREMQPYLAAGGGRPTTESGPTGETNVGQEVGMVPKMPIADVAPPNLPQIPVEGQGAVATRAQYPAPIGPPTEQQAPASAAQQPARPSGEVSAFGVPSVGGIVKGVGQGLFPGLFGYPAGTPGTEGGQVRQPPVFAPGTLAPQQPPPQAQVPPRRKEEELQ